MQPAIKKTPVLLNLVSGGFALFPALVVAGLSRFLRSDLVGQTSSFELGVVVPGFSLVRLDEDKIAI